MFSNFLITLYDVYSTMLLLRHGCITFFYLIQLDSMILRSSSYTGQFNRKGLSVSITGTEGFNCFIWQIINLPAKEKQKRLPLIKSSSYIKLLAKFYMSMLFLLIYYQSFFTPTPAPFCLLGRINLFWACVTIILIQYNQQQHSIASMTF